MRDYTKPYIEEENIEIIDVIAFSNQGNVNADSTEDNIVEGDTIGNIF